MPKTNRKKIVIVMLNVVAVFLAFSAASASRVFAGGGTIVIANHYPDDGETYEFIDHFMEQTTAVNVNTTVSVSIDGGPLIPLRFEGVREETAPGDTETRDWFTWQITVPAMTTPGNHTFQFFSHYYVWQGADEYWAEFNACSDVKSFSIVSQLPAPSQPPAESSKINQVYALAGVAASSAALLLLIAFFPRKTSGSNLRVSP